MLVHISVLQRIKKRRDSATNPGRLELAVQVILMTKHWPYEKAMDGTEHHGFPTYC
jgi:hypothetical protein